MKVKTERKKRTCLRCRYIWHSKVKSPVKCPRCGSRAWEDLGLLRRKAKIRGRNRV